MKIFGFVICLLAGGLIGYFIPHNQSFDFTSKNIDTTALNKLAANPTVLKRILSEYKYGFEFSEEPIKKEEALKLIADFRAQNALDIEAGGGMLGRAPVNGSPIQELGGFVISKETIDAIYKNDGTQDCTGLRIYLAKRPGASATSRLFTFIVVGTKKDGAKSTGSDIEAPIIEHVDPCPQNCGQLRPN